MNELIKVNYENDVPTVSARELHSALKIETRYNDWFARMCIFGFQEGKSYYSVLSNRSDGLAGKPRIEHILTITMAKELCMLQRNDIGKKFRQYFISIEEAWNSPERIIERALQIARERVVKAERKIFMLEEENGSLEIALNTSLQFFTVAKYNDVYNMNWSMKKCQRIGKELSTYCRLRSIEIRRCETNDERFGSVNSYPISDCEDFMEVDR